MKRTAIKRFGLIAGTTAAIVGIAVAPAVAARPSMTAPATSSSSQTDSTSATNDAKNQARLKAIISRGDKEIDRRIKTLNTLSVKIAGAKKLSDASKTALSREVKQEISALTDLKKKLDADADLATAQSDAQTIFASYRVYALIVPKVQLVKAADDQQVAEQRLTALLSKLQTRVDQSKSNGKEVAALQAALDDMQARTQAAQSASSGVEAAVINLQPADYNSNHAVLSGQHDKLKAAQDNIKAAIADAKTVVNGLKKQ